MASDVKNRVDAELAQIERVKAAFAELLESLKPHRENMKKVRAWRLNIKSNLARLSEPHRARLSEDQIATLNELRTALNGRLDALDGTIKDEAQVAEWLAEYQRYLDARRAVRASDLASKQPRWSDELSAAFQAVAQAHPRVTQYGQALEQAKRQQRTAEDRYTGLIGVQRDFNGKVDALSGTLSTRQDAQRWWQAAAEYQNAQQQASQAAESNPAWSTELAAIREQVRTAAANVEQFDEKNQQLTESRTVPDEDKRQELEQNMAEQMAQNDADVYLKVATDPQKMLVYAVPLDTAGLSEGGISDGIDVFNEIVDEYEDGDISDNDLSTEIKTAQGQIADFIGASVAQAIINAGYYPGNVRGQQLQRLEYTDSNVMRAATQYAQSLAGKYEPKSYAKQERQRVEIEPLQVAVTGRLSAPKQPNDQLDVKPLKIAIAPRLSRPIIHYEEDRQLPQAVVDELESFTHGPFKTTENHADTINSYHTRYGTLALELAERSTANDDLVSQAQAAVSELEGTIEDFSGEFNSSTGSAAVSALSAATDALSGATSKQAVAVSRAIGELENAEKQLKSWLQSSWYQYGGTPANHKASFSGDKSTYISVPKSGLKKGDF